MHQSHLLILFGVRNAVPIYALLALRRASVQNLDAKCLGCTHPEGPNPLIRVPGKTCSGSPRTPTVVMTCFRGSFGEPWQQYESVHEQQGMPVPLLSPCISMPIYNLCSHANSVHPTIMINNTNEPSCFQQPCLVSYEAIEASCRYALGVGWLNQTSRRTNK